MPVRNLIVVLGDQLDSRSAAFDRFDKRQDAVRMAEVADEAKHVWSHKARIAVFVAAVRHFRDDLRKRGFTIHYRQLDNRGNRGDFAAELTAAAKKHRPQRVVMVEPDEWRVKAMFEDAAADLGIELELRPGRHFFASHEDFEQLLRPVPFQPGQRNRRGCVSLHDIVLGLPHASRKDARVQLTDVLAGKKSQTQECQAAE